MFRIVLWDDLAPDILSETAKIEGQFVRIWRPRDKHSMLINQKRIYEIRQEEE